MKGPAPRLQNGKPSMTGVWDNTRRADVTNKAIPGFVKELPYTAWGKAKWEGYDTFMQTNGDYVGNCLPFGMSRSIYGPHPLQIIHDNDHLVMLFEQNSMFHLVPTDGRPFTKDLPPSWFGESVGRWDGDTLVVETVNINGFTRVDTIGHPMSARARITQTFKRVNFGTIEHTFTLTDPKTYTESMDRARYVGARARHQAARVRVHGEQPRLLRRPDQAVRPPRRRGLTARLRRSARHAAKRAGNLAAAFSVYLDMPQL